MGQNRLPGRSGAASPLHYFRLGGALGGAVRLRTADRAPPSPSALTGDPIGPGVHATPRLEVPGRAGVARGGRLYLVGVLEINLAEH